MYNEEITELYHVCWRPQPADQYPLGNPLSPVPTPHASAASFLATKKTPSKPVGAYRPPGARGTSTPLHFKREDEGGAAFINTGITSNNIGVNGFGKSRRREVPGAEAVDQLPPGAAPGGGVSLTGTVDGDENLSKAALKNKKKREAKKAKEAEAKASGLIPEGNGDGDRRDRPRSRSKSGRDGVRGNSRRREGAPSENVPAHRQNARAQPATPADAAPAVEPAPAAAPDVTVTSPVDGSPQDKKIRALLKKLRAIDDLKMRQAGGEKLEGTQVMKIGTEEGVRKELSALGFNE